MSLKDVIFKMSRHLIETCESSEDLRLKQTAFTRKRRLGAQNLLRILLHRLVDSLQLGIDAYYDFLQEDPVSKQAFSKARANLNPEYVRKFADGIAEIHAQASDAPTYAGMRLIAIDGTDIACPGEQSRAQGGFRLFGAQKRRRDCPGLSRLRPLGPCHI